MDLERHAGAGGGRHGLRDLLRRLSLAAAAGAAELRASSARARHHAGAPGGVRRR